MLKSDAIGSNVNLQPKADSGTRVCSAALGKRRKQSEPLLSCYFQTNFPKEPIDLQGRQFASMSVDWTPIFEAAIGTTIGAFVGAGVSYWIAMAGRKARVRWEYNQHRIVHLVKAKQAINKRPYLGTGNRDYFRSHFNEVEGIFEAAHAFIESAEASQMAENIRRRFLENDDFRGMFSDESVEENDESGETARQMRDHLTNFNVAVFDCFSTEIAQIKKEEFS